MVCPSRAPKGGVLLEQAEATVRPLRLLRAEQLVVGTDCTHSWETCPVHSTGDSEKLPSFKTMLLCVCGDLETKDGDLFAEHDADTVIDDVMKRLGG